MYLMLYRCIQKIHQCIWMFFQCIWMYLQYVSLYCQCIWMHLNVSMMYFNVPQWKFCIFECIYRILQCIHSILQHIYGHYNWHFSITFSLWHFCYIHPPTHSLFTIHNYSFSNILYLLFSHSHWSILTFIQFIEVVPF
jgi:hypothetical protein